MSPLHRFLHCFCFLCLFCIGSPRPKERNFINLRDWFLVQSRRLIKFLFSVQLILCLVRLLMPLQVNEHRSAGFATYLDRLKHYGKKVNLEVSFKIITCGSPGNVPNVFVFEHGPLNTYAPQHHCQAGWTLLGGAHVMILLCTKFYVAVTWLTLTHSSPSYQ